MRLPNPLLSRRLFVAGLAASVQIGAGGRALAAPSLGLLLPGKRDDRGFMEAGFRGFEAARLATGATAEIIDSIPPQQDALLAALRKLATGGATIVAAHGGQCNGAAKLAAAEFPNVEFLVIQGGVEGPNLTSYEVLQEESAWLAGAAAALLTKTGIVGHISGIRVPPGLKGRAGFAAGVKHVRPEVKLLTIFCGEQDDAALARRVALAEAEAGADIIFTMLNAGRTGATEACREKKIRQIGNVRDFTRDDPDVFVASALADVAFAMTKAVEDAATKRLKPGHHVRLGLATPGAVGLALAPDVPDSVRTVISAYAQQIVSGAIKVPASYDGPEFPLP